MLGIPLVNTLMLRWSPCPSPALITRMTHYLHPPFLLTALPGVTSWCGQVGLQLITWAFCSPDMVTMTTQTQPARKPVDTIYWCPRVPRKIKDLEFCSTRSDSCWSKPAANVHDNVLDEIISRREQTPRTLSGGWQAGGFDPEVVFITRKKQEMRSFMPHIQHDRPVRIRMLILGYW